MAEKTWFITGTSRGFGREWTIAALERGDRVAATARDPQTLDDLVAEHGDALLPLALDVTDRDAVVRDGPPRARALRRASTSSSTTPATGSSGWSRRSASRRRATRSRPTSSGRCGSRRPRCRSCASRAAATSSRCPRSAASRAFPGIGIYHASKWALEGISQALAQEVEGFGIHVTLIEPGGFSTDWGGSSARHAEPLDAYADVHEASRQRRGRGAPSAGDPTASAEAVLRIVDADEPPLRAFFGSAPLGIAEKDYEGRLATWREWQPVAEIAQGAG